MQIVRVFRARVVDIGPAIVDHRNHRRRAIRFKALLEVLRPFGIIEMVRTGQVAMTRGRLHARKRNQLPPEPERPTPRRRCTGKERHSVERQHDKIRLCT